MRDLFIRFFVRSEVYMCPAVLLTPPGIILPALIDRRGRRIPVVQNNSIPTDFIGKEIRALVRKQALTDQEVLEKTWSRGHSDDDRGGIEGSRWLWLKWDDGKYVDLSPKTMMARPLEECENEKIRRGAAGEPEII